MSSFLGVSFLIFHAAMGKSILITGGARSGKSTLAEEMTLGLGTPAVYIATAEARDDEMKDRIARHQARRGAEWTTIAEPLDLARVLAETDGTGPRLVDCLTLWLSNLMFSDRDWEAETQTLLEALAAQSDDAALAQEFAPVAQALAENEAQIIAELAAAQGNPADTGGYYTADAGKLAAVMRPSATLNSIIG